LKESRKLDFDVEVEDVEGAFSPRQDVGH